MWRGGVAWWRYPALGPRVRGGLSDHAYAKQATRPISC